MESGISENVASAYKSALNPTQLGSEFYTRDSLERLVSDLKAARSDPKQAMSKDESDKDLDFIKALQDLPSLTSTQRTQLNQCVPLPTDSARGQKLDQCLAVVDDVRQAALRVSASTAIAQIAAESSQKMLDQRQSLHAFWIQGAQLILLNLLLPLLTALFGYIFGTQHASGSTAS
jgi:hypothetical protein